MSADRDAYRVGSDYNQDYGRIRQAHKRSNSKFEDWEFPPGEDAIGEIDLIKMLGFTPKITWRRPHEIVRLMSGDPSVKPTFIDPKKVSRFQIKQGKLGNCWYLAGMSTLTLQKEVFRVVVPEDNFNGFADEEYCGAFYFRFWRAGVWTDVIIDDRLPCVDVAGKVELLFSPVFNYQFWSTLAEKAFAKMYRSYEAIEGGFPEEALEDFSGGIGEMVLLHIVPKDFQIALLKAYEKKSFIGISSVNEPEEGEEIPEGKVLGDGIVPGHAYSVTKIEQLKDRDGVTHILLRLRNPWGHGEWNGKWSDKDDDTWATVHKDLRLLLKNENLDDDTNDDGEFWISYEDAMKRCDVAHFCHWAPETLDRFYSGPQFERTWNINCISGRWSNELRGSGDNLDDLSKYPAHRVTVETGAADGGISVVISLMYTNYARSGPDETNPVFGFRIFQISEGDKRTKLDTDFFKKGQEITEDYIINGYHLREATKGLQLQAGDYCIVPCIEIEAEQVPDGTPIAYMNYLLRIFTERV